MRKIAGVIDGGSCGIGVESTVVDTTSAVPMILRPGGITREMLEEVLGAVEIDPALGKW
ncbi:MAG: L-threonylcarbamoyladenylate synthase [Phascolarctobacterium faecium]